MLDERLMPAATPDGEQPLTPRERLELYLNNQKPGSTRIQAIADTVELDKIERRISQKLFERRSDMKKTLEAKLTADYTLFTYLVEEAVIKETMRKRKFGANAAEYNSALEGASHMLSDYYNHERNEARKSDRPTNEDHIRESASDNLLRDLWSINNSKSSDAK